MEEEIVVDDVDENSSAETQQMDDSTTPVVPLLYIQQSKLRSSQTTNANQTLVSPSTQLAAIINPVNNQVTFTSLYLCHLHNAMCLILCNSMGFLLLMLCVQVENLSR